MREGSKMTEEQKQHIRNSLKKFGKRTAWNKGIPMKKEAKQKLRLANLGKVRELAGNWKGGREEYAKKLALENLPNKCNLCNSIKNLHIHHKDLIGTKYGLVGLSEIINNRLDNLEILCSSCHRDLHNKIKKKSVLVLFSSGLDSTTALYWALSNFKQVSALTFDYQQIHSKEVKLSKTVTDLLKIKHWIIQLDTWQQMKNKISLIQGSLEKIKTHRKIEEMISNIPNTFVPGRNLLFLTIAGAFCSTYNIDFIVTGFNYIDASGYPDTRPEFVKITEESIRLAIQKPELRIFCPLIYLTKAQIIKLGTYLDVDYSKTWSCYQGREKACGKCDTCKLRMKGFKEAGVKDPTKYLR